MNYYKFLTAGGKGSHSGHKWSLPTDTEPGEWLSVTGPLVECENGIHACRPQDVSQWIDAAMYELEYDDEPLVAGSKVYGRRARLVRRIDAWNDRTARLFAADCAERVSHLWVAPAGCNWKPSDTLDVVRRFAVGDATAEELDAARDSAWDAARDSTRAAARDSAWAAARDSTWAAARYSASDSASDSARDSAWAAASDSARDAERKWQSARLLEVTESTS